jgi:hypothetical protein
MTYKAAFILVVSILLLISACGILEGEKKDQEPITAPVYASIVLNDTLSNGRYKQGIVAIDYNNPKEFTLLDSGSSIYEKPRISPDGRKLIYGDPSLTGLHPQYLIYNIEAKTKEPLQILPHGNKLVGNTSFNTVWNETSDGFYFTTPFQAFSGSLAIYHYSLDESTINLINSGSGYSIYLYDMFSPYALLVFSNKFGGLDQFLMDRKGKFIHKLDNRYLRSINERGITKRSVSELEWNESQELLIGTYKNRDEFGGTKIILTDLEG